MTERQEGWQNKTVKQENELLKIAVLSEFRAKKNFPVGVFAASLSMYK